MADVYHEVMRTIWDHNLHFGLWTSEEDQSSNRLAAERMTALHIDKLGARHGRRVLDLGRRVGTSAFRLAEASHADIVPVSPCAEQVRLANVRAEALFVDDQAGSCAVTRTRCRSPATRSTRRGPWRRCRTWGTGPASCASWLEW
ncbi:SAM-dependent methyltransferase [Lentzea atacamensis]|uniref:SAM-dependent methyltransferase n=1 Tax=Lentzea atacamensis TaxID=531938 RepID=UPI000D6C1ADF|nr:hypothetical protein [Lentzea atacamensis]